MLERLFNEVESAREDIFSFFNDLHSFPELGFAEERTAAKLADALEAGGFTVERNVGGTTGVIGTLKGAAPGPVFALRADMDALPIDEDSGHPFSSKNRGVMHACGHDAHSTIVLFAALLAARAGIAKGTLKVLFQPAEELLTGALAMLKSGRLSDVDEMVGLHLRPIQEARLDEASPALMHGSSYVVNIAVEGRSAHGARPHLGVNAVDAAAAIVNAINAIRVDPRVSHSFKTTSIMAGGKASNIIPDSAKLVVDVRAQTNEVMQEILEKIALAAEYGAKSVGGAAAVESTKGVPAAEYDPALTEVMRLAAEDVLGSSLPPIVSPGGEDFHFFATEGKIKTAYLALGADLEPGLHSEKMRFDPEALIIGTKILCALLARKVL